jgi:phosphoribosylaminoimidazole-succinocarboxamide synthase
VAVDIAFGPKLNEGKTKIMYGGPDERHVYMVHKDAITAGDGAKRDVIEGKSELSCRTTSAVFRYLQGQGIPTHYVATLDPRIMLVRRVEMIPIEWVARRLAAGSYVRRTGTPEGTRFEPVILELFLKDDARHDPQITAEEAVQAGLCGPEETAIALNLTEQVFLALEKAWAAQDIQLVDLKIEFGRSDDGLLVADVIDNDSWRIWPGGRRELMLDKQVYRELQASSADALADVRRRYAEVAERVERFGQES